MVLHEEVECSGFEDMNCLTEHYHFLLKLNGHFVLCGQTDQTRTSTGIFTRHLKIIQKPD